MSTPQKKLIVYETQNGKLPFKEWILGLKDQKARTVIWTRLDRFERYGHSGESRSIDEDIFELKIRFGPGYRVYYAEEGRTVILLLMGGDKSTQKRDIQKALEYWKEYRTRI